LPFVSEVTGAPVNNSDGISFLPVVTGKGQPRQHDYLYWEFYEGGFKQAIKKDNWKAIRFYKGTQPDRTELYDLLKDEGEKHDLSAGNKDKVKELEMLMDQVRKPSESPLFQIQ
jgi:arylsulfatase A-like enzyme